MSFEDKSIQCSDCGTTFTFSAGEQEFFQSKGFTNEPKRCPSCRRANKARRSGNGNYSYSSKWWMFCAFYARCRKDTFDKSSQLSEKCIEGGEFKVSNQIKLRTLYSLLAMGILVLIAGLTLVIIMWNHSIWPLYPPAEIGIDHHSYPDENA